MASTIRPAEVNVAQTKENSASIDMLIAYGIRVGSSEASRQSEVSVSRVQEVLGDSHLLEDLLIAYQYGGAARVEASELDHNVRGLPLWLKDEPSANSPLLKMEQANDPLRPVHLSLRRPFNTMEEQNSVIAPEKPRFATSDHNFLIPGHYLKLAGQIMKTVEGQCNKLNVDQWAGHAQHDSELSSQLLEDANIVFCE